jgi:hypothetical protein
MTDILWPPSFATGTDTSFCRLYVPHIIFLLYFMYKPDQLELKNKQINHPNIAKSNNFQMFL